LKKLNIQQPVYLFFNFIKFMGIFCGCCSIAPEAPPGYFSQLEKNNCLESTRLPCQIQQKQIDVSVSKQNNLSVPVDLEHLVEDNAKATLSTSPRTSESPIDHIPSVYHDAGSVDTYVGPEYKQVGGGTMTSEVILSDDNARQSMLWEDNSHARVSTDMIDHFGGTPANKQTAFSIKSVEYDEVNERRVNNEDIVSQEYLIRALSGEDLWKNDARHTNCNSIGIQPWDVSWLRNDFEPDFIETLQLAEKKMMVDGKGASDDDGMFSEFSTDSSWENEYEHKDSLSPLKSDAPVTDDSEYSKKEALLDGVLSRSKCPKITNKELRALKRKLVDAYIDAIPSSRRHLTMISIAVDQIWKDVTERKPGGVSLLAKQYTRELKWLRSRKDENTKKENTGEMLIRAKNTLHSRTGVDLDEDPGLHKRYKTPT